MKPTRCSGNGSVPEVALSVERRSRVRPPVRSGGGPRARTRVARRHGESGLTLIEIMVSFTLLVVGVLGFSKVIIDSLKTNSLTRETALATEAARRTIEALQAAPFDDVFALYNGSAADDPGGVGTAPGSDVRVPGLQALPSDADGAAGEIVFPTPGSASGVLREDLADVALGTPRDLNGDTLADGLDHALDYEILPVVVRVTWRGAAGRARVELRTLLGGIQ